MGADSTATQRDASIRLEASGGFDWSERLDHLAGSLAVTLFDHSRDQGWLHRTKDLRALLLTPPGDKALSPWIQSNLSQPSQRLRRRLQARTPAVAPLDRGIERK